MRRDGIASTDMREDTLRNLRILAGLWNKSMLDVLEEVIGAALSEALRQEMEQRKEKEAER